ncbi:MAG: ABC transporter substrate-binding protein [Cyclobacteriaceae bacterium]
MNSNKSLVPIIILVSLMISPGLMAQDYKRQYKSAREFFDNKNYGLAMEAFKPLIVYDKDNSFLEHSSFFYALSAYHQKFPAVAKDMLVQIKQLYPDWSQMAEVNYWMAKIYFDQRQYFQAMQILREYSVLSQQKNVSEMKRHYLKEIEDVEVLRMMWEEHPQDTVVAKLLARAISKQPFLDQDTKLIDSLITKFNFSREEFEASLKPVNVFKDKYVVSLLFPFLAKTLEPTTSTKVNQSILDLYLGIKMAVDTLKAQGINIDLRSYDTERSTAATTALLEVEELKSTDLIVGPLFPNQTKLVQDFSINNKINMMSPVSNNSEFLGPNPFALLLQPSSETIGARSAEWIAANISNKNCMVFYGEAAKDTVTAASFLKRAKELELNIVLAEKVSRENSGTIFNKLATPVEYDEFKNPIEFELKVDSIGSVFVASDDPIIYTKAISGVDTRGDSVIIVGNESWLNNAAANFATYERLHITMTAPTFTKLSSPSYKAFRKEFIRKHGVTPTENSKVGYEFMWFVGHSLKSYGVYFQDGLKESPFISGHLFKGYDFSEGQSNQFVPFIHFMGGEVEFLENHAMGNK